ncbi:flagellar hook-length control protein FliK [Pseudoduganella lurida]|uniref:Flagellar hook-length control protein FliK n=1 Tax=Pseudoduganella lurida TaxID=1036180 RepID=A0A562RGU7_9BURK|nr:flagellar hook-length control protein FliK [Pseudoduganella lurida]TWI67596.1 flagellar hook-length control protein FliK [Pseudoduganella lurida]
MMMTFPSAPGGAAAADLPLPGAPASTAPAGPEGVADPAVQLPAFAVLLDLAGLAQPGEDAAVTDSAPAAAADDTPSDATLDASGTVADTLMPSQFALPLPAMNLAILPALQNATAGAARTDGTPRIDMAAGQPAGAAPLPAVPAACRTAQPAFAPDEAGNARPGDAAAVAAAAAGASSAATTPALLRILQAVQPAANTPAPAVRQGGDARPAVSDTVAGAPATAQPVLAAAATDARGQAGGDTPSGNGDNPAAFRTVMAANAGTAPTADGADTVRLAGSPDQWQQPLRAALGDRLQLQLQKNSEQAVIRLDPPNLGSIEISIRHSGGALQVNLAASNGEVLRQLNAVGDAMRQDLSSRQFSDVAVTVSATSNRTLADSEGRGRQQGGEQQQGEAQRRQPGRALSDGDDAGARAFAMGGNA